MKEKMKDLGISLFFLGCALCIFGAGSTVGFSKGYAKAFEDSKKTECQLKYGQKPQSEIAGNCLKYFVVK